MKKIVKEHPDLSALRKELPPWVTRTHPRFRELTGYSGRTLANFDCRVVKVFDESTHHAFLCEVLATRGLQDGEPLLYLNGAFRRLAPQS